MNYICHRALLPSEAIVGDNLILEHYALGVVMHPNVVIGNDCRIYHHVTIAGESAIGGPYRVTVGDRVTIGANAVILPRSNTALTIGDDAVVGAGAVVTSDVPAGAIVVGVPAKVIRYCDDLKNHSPSEVATSDHDLAVLETAAPIRRTKRSVDERPVNGHTVNGETVSGRAVNGQPRSAESMAIDDSAEANEHFGTIRQ